MAIGGTRSNFVGSDTIPIRHRPDFKQTSVVNLASPQECRGSSLSPKLVAKLFLIVVAMARFLVASITWDITATMDLTLIERGNLRKSVNRPFTCGMSLTMNLVQNYSDHFGNSQRSSLSPTGGVKGTSPTTENGYENCTYTARISARAMRTTSRTQTTSTRMTRTPTRASCTNQWARPHWARCFVVTPWCHMQPYGSRCSWVFLPSACHPWASPPWPSPSSLSTSTCPSSSSSTPPSWCTPSSTLSSTTWSPCNPTCATAQKGSNDGLRRLLLPHRLWAQRHGPQRARQLPGFLLLHYTVIGPGHRRHYARQAAHRKHTENMPITAVRKVCPSVSRHSLSRSIEQGNLWEKQMSISLERRGQESRNTTACTKNFWKMLAMGNQRAVCERRQLQFPPRYE